MAAAQDALPLIDDEPDVLADRASLAPQDGIELGCGAARLARPSHGCNEPADRPVAPRVAGLRRRT